eukprot:NODE_235_length_11996_cov_1.212070.p6 type:complete len:123 gc:universal NODE_235_length_11996_cov_1.212070:7762-8130(+)
MRSVNILYGYKKSNLNPILWFDELRPLFSGKIFCFGDININLLRTLTTRKIVSFDLMASEELLKYDVYDNENLTYTFYKTDTSYTVTDAYHIDLFHLSDHKAIVFDLALDDSDVLIFEKRPR